jgi:TldD protein
MSGQKGSRVNIKEKVLETVDYLKSKGATYADIRSVRIDTETIRVKDFAVDSIVRDASHGFGVRVIADGAWGFAATSTIAPGALKKAANRALQIARASALCKRGDVRLADADVVRDTYATPYATDPFTVKLGRKVDALLSVNEILKRKPQIRVAESSMQFFRTRKLFASTEGSLVEQDILESGAGFVATAVEGGEVQRRSYPSSFGGDFGTGGYEIVEAIAMRDHAEPIREEAIALLTAPPMPAGRFDVILGGSQLGLQIHESCGHPTELDRALGTEISLAGASFLTVDRLGSFRYGSPLVTITADATIPGALGTFGYDDEGVKAQRFPIIREGIFVGYLTSRETAPVIGQRANGAMRADSWASLPLIRMTNISLEPGAGSLDALLADTNGGFFMDSNKSWSIDDHRLNFQFGMEIAWKIEGGRKGQIYKNPLYTGNTPVFWGSCDAICGKEHWRTWGVPNCGKGEPMQTARVAHGASPARFRGLEVGVSA